MNAPIRRDKREFDIEVNGVTFTCRSCTYKENAQLFENQKFSAWTDIAVGTITKITPDKFEDGSPLTRSTVLDLDDEIISGFVAAWVTKRTEMEKEAAAKREQQQAFKAGS